MRKHAVSVEYELEQNVGFEKAPSVPQWLVAALQLPCRRLPISRVPPTLALLLARWWGGEHVAATVLRQSDPPTASRPQLCTVHHSPADSTSVNFLLLELVL